MRASKLSSFKGGRVWKLIPITIFVVESNLKLLHLDWRDQQDTLLSANNRLYAQPFFSQSLKKENHE
jgi:hypothetical protein